MQVCQINPKDLFAECFPLIKYAPLAQLVEQLTLNQRVPGSSPWWRTIMARWSSG